MQPQWAGCDGCWLRLATSKQFALQLQHLLNAQTWGTHRTSKEHQPVLKILYSLENTAFSTVCSVPPSFNPHPHCLLPLHRGQGNVSMSARAAGKPRAGFTDPASIFPGEWAALEPLLVPSSKVLFPPKPPVKPNSQCQAQPLELVMALGGWGHPLVGAHRGRHASLHRGLGQPMQFLRHRAGPDQRAGSKPGG